MLVLNRCFLQVNVFTQQLGLMCLLSLFLSLLTKLLRVYSWAVIPPRITAKLAHAGLIAILNVIDCQTVSVILKSVKSRFNIVILTSWKWRDIVTWTIFPFLQSVYTLLIQFNDRREIYSKVYIESEHKATFHFAVRYDAFIKKGIIQIIYWCFIGSTTLLVRKYYIPEGSSYLVTWNSLYMNRFFFQWLSDKVLYLKKTYIWVLAIFWDVPRCIHIKMC